MLWLPATPETTRIFADFFQSRVFSGDEEPLSVPVVDWVNPCRPVRPEAAVGQPPRKRQRLDGPPVRIDGVGPPPPGPASPAHRSESSSGRPRLWLRGTHRGLLHTRAVLWTAPLSKQPWTARSYPWSGGDRAGMADARELRGSKKARSVDDFLKLGFQVKEWDGIDGVPLVDSSGRVFAALAGRPKGPAYDAHIQRAFCLMVAAAAARAAAKTAVQTHRRGFYAAITVGISYGQGQTEACSLEAEYPELAEQLVEDSAFQELASFASSMLAFWAPQLYEYYLFAAATFNLGPNVWTFKHRDVLNLPFGWCAITALGDFDHTKGGHLVLWDLKLVVQFPLDPPS
ncbi:hypothetical protein HMN09_01419100 [Mycena chlorophos]|uniref:Uncharacterized protein n=1 Tax=Mycena chlorophos TaxID=658473 RepID=A0A8H6VNE5_MYCCL|nr:hypothetical protein HMN09_01419100 [Mycena chlorophos]